MYGIPKIHKPGTPLRPIVSCVSCFAYNLSKHLAGILSPLTGNTPNTVPNSTAFAEFLRGQHIDSHEALISFDVKWLFTNVPIGDACCVALRRLEEDPELPDRPSLSPTKIVSLLKVVLRSTYFLYGGVYYEQTDGTSMGSPVSAVIANLYMEASEEEALQSCPPDCRPTVWKRYVDDTFVIAPRDIASHLLNHLNSLKPSIRFTIENEQDSSIAFLDTMVHREPDGSLTGTVYRKPTHTDQYLAFDSPRPESVKRGVANCLHDRALRLVSRPRCTAAERHRVTAALMANGYPSSFIRQSSRSKTSTEAERPEYKAFTVLPFMDGISGRLKRILEDQGVCTVFRSSTTLRSQLVRLKDPIPPRRRGVVYRIPCGDCDKVYVGKTGRPVDERIKEHQCDVRLSRVDSSAVAVQCVDQDQHWYTRRIKEAIHICLNRHSINREAASTSPGSGSPPSVNTFTAAPGHNGATPRTRPFTPMEWSVRRPLRSPVRGPQYTAGGTRRTRSSGI
ncbi:uncharacterized protein LOC110986850 [Acanthaster planci]|uniref:Uncharacterized protein LOC110986850 n=1 Tax=Acanthaster planci TaxID=133434 RepID=A0A8B7ZIT7_ACAPL|nr:uncharacterized protein LOC110986850 [Acanthaster planci]